MKKKMKGFTLIELIAVLVIMVILALIVTPLVMSIIKKAKVSAYKRSIDAYGRSIELAIAGYLLDNGTLPTSIGELTIEYSGEEVVCSTTQLNSDSSVYLAGCTVGGRSVEGYTYGKEETVTYDAYSVGDEVTYNNINYYVIKDSDASESTVTLLKAEPLSYEEIQIYAVIPDIVISDNGGVAYYTSETCGYVNGSWVSDGCTSDYDQSKIKYIVDDWKEKKATLAIEARLITFDELTNNLGYEVKEICTGECYQVINKTEYVPEWVYNNNYGYWTMTTASDSSTTILDVTRYGEIRNRGGSSFTEEDAGRYNVVRPVIVLPKSAISS